jgi:hypothetical protein
MSRLIRINQANQSRLIVDISAIHISVLVDLGLSKAVDLLSTVLNLAVGCLEATQNTGALLDVVVAHQLVVCNAVESTVA